MRVDKVAEIVLDAHANVLRAIVASTGHKQGLPVEEANRAAGEAPVTATADMRVESQRM